MAQDSVYIGNSAIEISVSPANEPYTGVVLTVDGVVKHQAGNLDGKVLTVETPYATPAMASNILTKINGYRYQPVTANNAQGVDPAVELGDGMTAGGAYSGVYGRKMSFGAGMVQTLSADGDTEVEHEYVPDKKSKYATKQGLAAGTTEVNGSGLTPSSVSQSKTNKYINDGVDDGYSSATTIDGWTNGTYTGRVWMDHVYANDVGAGNNLFFGDFQIEIGERIGDNVFSVIARHIG